MILRFCVILLTVGFFPGAISSVASPQKSSAERQVTAEQLAETVILIYGSRPALSQIRRNGLERGKLTLTTPSGSVEEATYERRFIRGESSEKDRFRLDHKQPSLEYSLLYRDGRVWGIVDGAPFVPRQDATVNFLSEIHHGIDALLRYKEDGSTITLIGKEKQKGVEYYVLDLVDKTNRRTRYYISAKLFRVSWVEYEDVPPEGGAAVKYMRRFSDYRPAQGTLVPYRTVFFENGKQVVETQLLTVTYGVRMEESLFGNPESETGFARP